MRYIYGPIPSRRLGRSLGIDPVPLKTCNWNCVYCQLGRTVPLTNERRAYVPRTELIGQLQEALAAHGPGEIDWISFVGSGEPTLHRDLGWMIRRVKELSALPVTVITNGSLLHLPDVREELLPADAVMPTLTSASPAIYRRLHRPHPAVTLEGIIAGLIAFREEYNGLLWIEVMLVQGINDSEPDLRDLAALLSRIQPDEVHITLPTRPPAEPWVAPPDAEGLMRATAILGDIAQIVHPSNGGFYLGDDDDVVEAVVGIITRHPMTQTQVVQALEHWAPAQVEEALSALAAGGQAQPIQRLGQLFWTATPSCFPTGDIVSA